MCAQTEWSSNPEPAGVTCTDIYAPGRPRIANYHDTAAQASFAAKTAFLIDGMFPLFSYWAFSDICAFNDGVSDYNIREFHNIMNNQNIL